MGTFPLRIQASLRYVAITDSPSVPVMFGLSVSYRYNFAVTPSNHSTISDSGRNEATEKAAHSQPSGGDPEDPDGDGVPSSRDACPHTPAGAQVQSNGCRPLHDGVLSDITFDEEGTITPQGKTGVTRLAELLRANPQVAARLMCVHPDSAVAAVMCSSLAASLEAEGIGKDRLRPEPGTGNVKEVRVYFVLP